jgi:hypothetical protein
MVDQCCAGAHLARGDTEAKWAVVNCHTYTSVVANCRHMKAYIVKERVCTTSIERIQKVIQP